MRIQKLQPHIVQQIAAGEVIERPASVLKELIENSIDAGATQIKVEHDGGGLALLRVTDDGLGISQEEMPLVFESHATSKLKSLSDFEELRSMGFRGEAMSAIASVADLRIWSSTESSRLGCRAHCSFGSWKGVEAADSRVGTEIECRDLFSRLPVRLRFMKSPKAEARQLLSTFRRYALNYPEIHWTIEDLSTSRKLQLSPQSWFDRCRWFFEIDDPKHWVVAESQKGSWKVRWAGLAPRYVRPGRSKTFISLNRRPIKDRSLDFALRRAFEGYTEYPGSLVGALELEGDPGDFDVNVHPTKVQIRFKDADSVFSAIVHTLRDRLEEIHRETRELAVGEEFRPKARLQFGVSQSKQTPELKLTNSEFTPDSKEGAKESDKLFQTSAVYEYMGQVDHSFLVAKKLDKLFIFDQHALHERILYEELWKSYREQRKINTQRQLFPLRIDFEGAEILLEHEELLESLGFELRQWQDSGVQILSAPAVLKRDHDKVLKALVESRENSKESILREALATIACHSAIRAHDPISEAEAKDLFQRFQSEDALGHCPHGRPTFILMERSDLERFFNRK